VNAFTESVVDRAATAAETATAQTEGGLPPRSRRGRDSGELRREATVSKMETAQAEGGRGIGPRHGLE